jgi:1-acyl-sn-glycerol-3-phosphate acyltransferase
MSERIQTSFRPVLVTQALVAYAYSILSLVLFIPVALLALPFDRRQRVHDVCSVLWAKGILRLAGLRLRVQGGEHASRDEHYIVVANHQSLLDAMVMVAAIQPLTPVRMVAKRTLFKVPILGWGMQLFGHIPVDQRSARASLAGLQQAQQGVKQRWSTVFFPEGTRSPDGRLLPFHNSAFHIASRAGVRVLPVTISGSQPLLPKYAWFPVKRGVIDVTVHPPVGPFEASHDGVRAAATRCRDVIGSALPEDARAPSTPSAP